MVQTIAPISQIFLESVDLIRQDMQDRAVALNILEEMADLRHGRFSDKSILDLKEED